MSSGTKTDEWAFLEDEDPNSEPAPLSSLPNMPPKPQENEDTKQ